ncbi:hypothetical protein [Kitasatospora sp. MMS16-BH015]|nr:hypothetical protein [Kitasatospora sp. MMS16-BH015]
MTYQFDTARATIDERLREAEQYRMARAIRRSNRQRRTIKSRFQTSTTA